MRAESQPEETFVVVEKSALGEQVIGVFSTIEAARAVLPRDDVKRLVEDFRVELHLLDRPNLEPEAWRVTISREAEAVSASRVVLCACEDDHEVLNLSSYIEDGGESMQLIVWAPSMGGALLAADRQRRKLQEQGVWGTARVPLAPILMDGL